jgi:hypothetical protein
MAIGNGQSFDAQLYGWWADIDKDGEDRYIVINGILIY